MLKRGADWLEKISAGSMLIGIFQGDLIATVFGLLTFCGSLYLQWGKKWQK